MNKFLYEYSIDVFSQNGEDGINKEIFEHLKERKPLLIHNLVNKYEKYNQ